MATLAPVDRSTLRLSEVARHVVIPEGIVDSLWYDVVERCEEFGDTFDAWQDGLGEAILGVRADGMFAATVGGVTMSIPRQVAKTFIVGRICIALCTLYPNLTVIWTAHRTRTATRTFQSLKAVAMRPGVAGYLRPGSNNGTAIRDTNGEQAIPFVNGSEILFGAREGGFGRGFDEVDIEVFDEAQILGVKALEDMVAATNQTRFEFGALLFYMGTPPRPTDPGEVFTERRDDALHAKQTVGSADFGPVVQHGDALYVECSADVNVGHKDGPGLDDPKQVEKANPSYPHRTPPVSVKRLRKNLPGDDAWRREGLGVWDPRATSRIVIQAKPWADLKADKPGSQPVAYGVKFSPDGNRCAIAVALRDGDSIWSEVAWYGATDVAAVADWLTDGERWRKVSHIAIDGKTGAPLLLEHLRRKKVHSRRLVAPTVDQVTAAHQGFLEAVQRKSFHHSMQPGLTQAVGSAGKRLIGTRGGWGWEQVGEADITPLEAVTFAHWAASMAKRRTTTAMPRRIN